MKIAIVGTDSQETTARYFEIAATRLGLDFAICHDLEFVRRIPDLELVLVVDPLLKDPHHLLNIACPCAGYLIDVHQEIRQRLIFAKYLDLAFVAQRDYLDQFSSLPHPNVHWLPLGCDPQVHFFPEQERVYDVAFVGKFGDKGSERALTLEKVLSSFQTNIVGRKYTPVEMGTIYSSSKIVFNKSIKRDLNMRFFEGLASGALLITDQIDNGMDCLGLDDCFVTYKTDEEAMHKISYYLDHEDERKRIAARGMNLAHAEHTYVKRLEYIIRVSSGGPSRQRAPARSAPEDQERLWRSELLKIQGASMQQVFSMLGSGGLSGRVIANIAIGFARNNVRRSRQWLSSRR